MEICNGRKRVAFFDSGIGGLSLFIKCAKLLPNCDFYYFADNYNVPYGNLSDERITELADEKFAEIEKIGPSAAVIACNTVTAVCAPYLRGKYSFPIIGIQPAVKPAAAHGGRCAVLATTATAKSVSMTVLADKFAGNNCEVVACPYLAAYIEENIMNISECEVVRLLPEIRADSVVLGCTHYAFIEEIIKKHYKIPVFDGLDGTASRLVSVLGDCGQKEKNGRMICFAGGDLAKNMGVFYEFAAKNPTVRS